jgi:hypothetical protein
MRALGRWLGYGLLALAVIAAAWDGVETARLGAYSAATLGEWWSSLAPRSLDAALAWSPWFTAHVLAAGVAAPAWAILGVPGFLLAILCRRRNGRRRRARSRGL